MLAPVAIQYSSTGWQGVSVGNTKKAGAFVPVTPTAAVPSRRGVFPARSGGSGEDGHSNHDTGVGACPRLESRLRVFLQGRKLRQ